MRGCGKYPKEQKKKTAATAIMEKLISFQAEIVAGCMGMQSAKIRFVTITNKREAVGMSEMINNVNQAVKRLSYLFDRSFKSDEQPAVDFAIVNIGVQDLISKISTLTAELEELRGRALDTETSQQIQRMCDCILGNTFGNKELDSLALYVGHHPLILNPPKQEATDG